MADGTKFSALPKEYTIPASSFFAGYSSTGTVTWPSSSVNTMVWSNSANYNLDKIQPVYTTVNTNSASWSGTTINFISGGTLNQIWTKDGSADYAGSWKNKRLSQTLPPLTATGTINCNALSADQFVVSISGMSVSATFTTPVSPYDAQLIMWNVRYNTNIAGVSLSSDFRTPNTTLNWSISANTMDIFAAKYNALDLKWDVVSFAPGYHI